jgi:lactoylglutathione lyase
MKLGVFSLSLNVRDIKSSFDFYQKLGFTQIGGKIDALWLILKNDQTIIGLFQGMIEQNTLTFNPGWNDEAKPVDPYDDIRQIHDFLIKERIDVDAHITREDGPGYVIIKDPDGNPILIDQHR